MGIFDNNKKKDQEKFGLFNFMNEEQNNKNESEYTDQELDAYNLEDWEREQVERGENDPWNFDENELEDDDYYTEDVKVK